MYTSIYVTTCPFSACMLVFPVPLGYVCINKHLNMYIYDVCLHAQICTISFPPNKRAYTPLITSTCRHPNPDIQLYMKYKCK